jgi:hypothetical protein
MTDEGKKKYIKLVLNPERMSIENENCSSVCALSHWSKKLTNQKSAVIKLTNEESVLLKLTNQDSAMIKLTNQVREPLLMRESDFFLSLKRI